MADRFAPDIWLADEPPEHWAWIPFSHGPVRCPGRQLVLLLTSSMLASLLQRTAPHLLPATRLDPDRPLPGTLDNYSLRFALGR